MESDVIKKEKNTNNKKIIIVFGIILAIIISSLAGFTIYKYVKSKQEQSEIELMEKLDKCYISINDNYNFEEFKKIVSTLQDDYDKSKAYNKLSEALDNLVDNLYKDYNVGKSFKLNDFFKTMLDDKTIDSELVQIIETKNKYKNYIQLVIYAEQDIESGNYHGAYIAYSNAIKEIASIDNEKSEAIVKKRNEITDKAYESLKNELAKYISEQNYGIYYSASEESFIKNSENDELKNIYSQYLAEQKTAKKAKEKEKKKSQGVYIGMTKQQVLDSMWGDPTKINKTTTKYGISEQWVYPNNNYLYFENGKLTAIQN